MNNISIFIGFTPLHAKNAALIIDGVDGKVYCLFTKTWPKTSKIYNRLGLNIPDEGVLRSIVYILNFMYFSLAVKVLMKRFDNISIYIPHPANIFTNNLFFNKKISEVNLYEDGLLNYYDVTASLKRLHVATRMLARFFALPYREYRGHLSGFDARHIACIYLTQPKLAVAKHKFDKIIELKYTKTLNIINKGKILFLDQDTRSRISKEKRESLIYDMYIKFPKNKYTYLYKKHHDYDENIDMDELPRVLKNHPAEDVVSIVMPELIISFFSTALINIKNVNPNIKCLALAAKLINVKIDGRQSNLSQVFLANGVECW